MNTQRIGVKINMFAVGVGLVDYCNTLKDMVDNKRKNSCLDKVVDSAVEVSPLGFRLNKMAVCSSFLNIVDSRNQGREQDIVQRETGVDTKTLYNIQVDTVEDKL